MIYADFESILVPEDNGRQNPEESYTNRYQKYLAFSYVLKLVSTDGKLNKSFKFYLGQDDVYNFISTMIEESKYCTDIMNKHLSKNS